MEQQIQESMIAAGISPPNQIIIDGNLHRFDNKSKGKTGWYVIFPDGVPAGRFGCWRDGVDQSWRAHIDRPLSMLESMQHARRMSESKKMRDDAKLALQSIAAQSAIQIWEESKKCDSNAYLARKNVNPNGARLSEDGRLVIPVYSESGEIQSLQFISENGEKRFLKSGKMKCGHYIIGEPERGSIYIAEGFATSATIHEVTGSACVVAFSGGNMLEVAEHIKAKFSAARDIVIVGDNDESGKGQEYAIAAGEATGCRVILPPEKGDINDYAACGGDVLALLCPPRNTGWLIPVSDFCAQPAPIKWLVRGWLQSDALMMVHGPSGGGKTFVVLDWVLRISSGINEWCGKKVTPGSVVYLAGEGHHGLRGRVAAWKHKNEATLGNMWLSSDGCELNTPEGYITVVESIKTLPSDPSIIIVDTLHRFLNGDENSAQDAKTMIDACAGLMREFGCSVVLVHHTGTGGTDRARGSTAWRGALDIEIGITPGENGGPMKISQHKSKDSEQSKDVYVKLESVDIPGWVDEDGEQVKSAVIVQSDAPEAKKKDTEQHMKTFKNAWFEAGAEVRDNRPYISKSALKNKLEKDGRGDRTVKNDLNPSYNNKLIGFLILNKFITTHEHGWIVINDTESSAMMISMVER